MAQQVRSSPCSGAGCDRQATELSSGVVDKSLALPTSMRFTHYAGQLALAPGLPWRWRCSPGHTAVTRCRGEAAMGGGRMPSQRADTRSRRHPSGQLMRRYDAFMSYSHAVDGKLAPALQLALHRFTRPWYRTRALYVFRDQTSLTATPQLWASIQDALASADHFILLASPEAAQSRWVDREVQWWLDREPPDQEGHLPVGNLLIVLTAGHISWNQGAGDFDWSVTTALPARLRGHFSEEPLWVDLTWARKDDVLTLGHPRFRAAVARLAAPLHRRPMDELDGEDVRQRRRTQRMVRATVAILASLLLLVGTLAVLATRERNATKTALDRVEFQHRLSISRELARKSVDLRSTQPRESALLAATAWRTGDTPEARGSLLSAQTRPYIGVLGSHAGAVKAVEFSRDGRHVATAGKDRRVRVWNVATRLPVGGPLAAGGEVVRVALSPDSSVVAGGNVDGTIRLWDIKTGRLIGRPLRGHTAEIASMAFEEASRILATADLSGSVRMWNLDNQRPIGAPLTPSSKPVAGIAFSPNGRILTTVSSDGTVVAWNAVTRRPVRKRASGFTDGVIEAPFSPGGRLIACVGFDRIRIWDVKSGRQLGAAMRGHTSVIWSAAFSPAGTTLATASQDGTLRLWDIGSQQQIGEPLTGHTGGVNSVAFSPDGSTLASGDDDGRVILWHAAVGHVQPEATAAFTSDGRLAAIALDDGAVQLWNTSTARPSGDPLSAHHGALRGMAFSPDGRTLLTASKDKTARLWDVASRRQIHGWRLDNQAPLIDVAFGPEMRTAALITHQSVLLADTTNPRTLRKPLISLNVTNGTPWNAAFSPDGHTVAVAYFGGPILLWNTTTHQVISGKPLRGHTKTPGSLAFSHDGRILASGDWDGTVRLWDVKTKRQIGEPLTGHTDRISGLAFSPDSRLLASVGRDDDQVLLWDVSGRSHYATLTGHTSHVFDVRFDDRGQLLGLSNVISLFRWDTDVEQVRIDLCAKLRTDLTAEEWRRYVPGDQPYRPPCSP